MGVVMAASKGGFVPGREVTTPVVLDQRSPPPDREQNDWLMIAGVGLALAVIALVALRWMRRDH